MRVTALEIIVFLAFLINDLPSLAVRTNVNEVNDLFDRHIENKEQLMRDIDADREEAVGQIEAGNGPQHIEGINEAEGKAKELESIREVDLESSGREKRVSEEYRFYDENELEPDYSKPGNLAHKRDADEIIAQTDLSMKKLGKDLQTRLSAVGIDCHQVKGAIQTDLTYHIEISGEEHRNIEYEQVFCEEPRNRYSCHDVLTTKCKQRGAVGELKYIIIDHYGRGSGMYALDWVRHIAQTRLKSNDPWKYDFLMPETIDLVPIYSEIKQMMKLKDRLLRQIPAFETIDADKIILPPQRYFPYRITVQKRTGEWFEHPSLKIWPFFYYDEGCVEWVDEWDEVCGLEP